MARALLARLAASALGATLAAGHASMLNPAPRNAGDRALPIFANGSWPRIGGSGGNSGCNCANSKGGCEAATGRPVSNGQACLWFSQGCTIGCEECTGTNGHTSRPLCNSSQSMEPTNNDPISRTENRGAAAGTAEDAYKYNPWRAPGWAPVVDACGVAGGTSKNHEGPGVAVFTSTDYAQQGDKGSEVLKKGPPAATWTAGAAVEVSWGIRYNHGGGYQYRLCPADEPLTEECFRRRPLEFVRGKQQLLWNNGTRLSIPGTWVDKGTRPVGSTWAMNPIPRINWGGGGRPNAGGGVCVGSPRGPQCLGFPPVCEEGEWGGLPWHKIEAGAPGDEVEGYCSGDWTDGQIVDEVIVPGDLPAGDYVVGWRWDCEETTQVWSSCADVRVVHAGAGA